MKCVHVAIRHFRNQRETGPSWLSQRLLGSNSWPAQLSQKQFRGAFWRQLPSRFYKWRIETKVTEQKQCLCVSLFIVLFTRGKKNPNVWRSNKTDLSTLLEISMMSICVRVSLGRVVQSLVKITQGQCEIWIKIWKLKKHFSFNSFCPQVDGWKL